MKQISFTSDELKIVGSYPAERPGARPAPILNSPITARENVHSFLAGETPLWIPH